MTPAAIAAGATRTLTVLGDRLTRSCSAARRVGGALLGLTRSHRPTRRGIAKSLVFAGGAITALGVALIYLPAGVILAGPCLIVWALRMIDVEPPRSPR